MHDLTMLIDRSTAGYSQRYTKELLDSMVHVGDPIADVAIAALAEAAYDPDGGQIDQLRDLAAVGDERAVAFFERANHRPDWYDGDAIERGQRVAAAFGPAYGMSLFHSLFAGAIFPRATLVTGATGRLGSGPERRIQETGAFVAAILQPGGLEPGSLGFDTTVRVRLLHSSIRSWLGKSEGFPERYVGVPIDQTMLAMTNSLFSYLNMRSLARLGIKLGDDDLAAHHHMWRYVGYLLGIDDRLLPETLDAEIEQWRALVIHQAFPDVLGERFLDRSVGSISSIIGLDERKQRIVRDLMLHLSGPGWFGLDEPMPRSPVLYGIRGLGTAATAAYRYVPGVANRLVRRSRRAMADGVEEARDHGYGVQVEASETEEHAAVMRALADHVWEKFTADVA